ncbi:arsenate reductase (glutaredoxin) [Celerinatantimonas yamalensis]|uniref:Arsenate reductase n=1 Tax=Celerinatantimonas yamalensis TaxID=559956 RepID=A0ABW9G9P1_9GAMM
MSDVIIYHNPRCSKSRQTLALLEEYGVTPSIVYYLKTPPDADTLQGLLASLGMKASELIRSKDALYKELDLAEKTLTESQWLEVLVAHPQLMERPIVVRGDKAVLGRPPENVLALIDD